MDNSAYVALSLARSLERSLDVVANNLANSDTAGYKAQRTDFQDLVEHSLSPSQGGVAFVQSNGSHIDPSAGALVKTGNPLDVALSGNGWFGYTTSTGQAAFGRDGRMAINAQGQLVTTAGAQVLDANGAPISIPATTGGPITIAGDGTITDAQGTVVGKIGVFNVPNIETYQRIGGGMLVAPDGGTPPRVQATGVRLSQGFIEQSNVEPVLEMTRMIDIQRAYERAMSLIQDDNSLRQQTLTQLGQAG